MLKPSGTLRALAIALGSFIFAETVLILQSAAQQTVTAPNGVAVGRDIVNSTIIITVPPRDLASIAEAATRNYSDITARQRSQIVTLRQEMGLPPVVLTKLFSLVHQEGEPPEKIPRRLVQLTEIYRRCMSVTYESEYDTSEITQSKSQAAQL